MKNRAGSFVQQQPGPDGYSAFIPASLPPQDLRIEGSLARVHESAAYALGRLDGVSARLDPERLLYMYVRKEAVLSSQIEGTQSTLSDLLKYENEAVPGTPLDDVREVSRYVDALLYAADQIKTGALPLSLRLIRNVHERLMRGGRGGDQAPGEFRRTQNWIGGTRPGNAKYVPPPPYEVMPALDNLEKFLHDEYSIHPPIIKAGLAHAQFETIHPFLDGNGRVGRLLICLILMADGALTNPFFYISLHFRQNRADYYDALQRIRTQGDWEGWLHFFLTGVGAVADQATSTAEALRKLFAEDRAKVEALGKAAPSALKVHDLLRERILLSATRGAKETKLSWPTVQKALERLENLGVVEEVTGRKRDRVYMYRRQLQVLDQGIDDGRESRELPG